MTKTRRSAAVLALIAGVALSQTMAGSVNADEVPVVLQFNQPAQTFEYGQYWSFVMVSDYAFYQDIYLDGTYEIASTGVPSTYKPVLRFYLANATGSGDLAAPYEVAPLGVGTYTFSVSGSGSDGLRDFTAQSAPATLTIEKAKLGVELRVLADPANADAAIVTAKFTGRFVDEYQSSFFPGAAPSPAGVWNITLTDSAGEVAVERTIERAAGDDVLSTSFYWTDAEPGEQYTASAQFTPEGASAANFAITQAGDFDYTAADGSRPVPTSTAPAEPDTNLPEATGFSLPLWLIVVAGVLILGLAALVTVLSVRLSRRSTSTTGEAAP